MWRQYFQNTQGLIFVVDNNDRDQVVEVRNELHRILLNEVSYYLVKSIFVVDNNDRDQVVEVRNELHRMLNEVSYYLVKSISI